MLLFRKIIILIDKTILKLDYTDYDLYQMEKKYIEGETALLLSKKIAVYIWIPQIPPDITIKIIYVGIVKYIKDIVKCSLWFYVVFKSINRHNIYHNRILVKMKTFCIYHISYIYIFYILQTILYR